MRTARTMIWIGLALALAPARASAESPRVSLRLDYALGKGGESCPAEPAALRSEVEKRMGYDPFDRPDAARERLAVVLVRKGGGYAATVERFNAAGVSMWAETFPKDPLQSGCAALISPLASYLRSMFLGYQGAPAAPVAPPPEPAPPAPTPPPAVVAPLAPTARPSKPPEPPDVPNPSPVLATRVAIVSYATAGILLGLAIGWTVDEQNKRNAAQTLAAQPNPAGGMGDNACYPGAPPGSYCGRLLSAWQAHDTAIGLRNGWYIGAGVSAAVGITATVWGLNLPRTIKGPVQAQVTLKPGGVALSGAF